MPCGPHLTCSHAGRRLAGSCPVHAVLLPGLPSPLLPSSSTPTVGTRCPSSPPGAAGTDRSYLVAPTHTVPALLLGPFPAGRAGSQSARGRGCVRFPCISPHPAWPRRPRINVPAPCETGRKVPDGRRLHGSQKDTCASGLPGSRRQAGGGQGGKALAESCWDTRNTVSSERVKGTETAVNGELTTRRHYFTHLVSLLVVHR